MIKQTMVVTLILMLAIGNAYAYGGMVNGTVTESVTGEPIPYASVQVDGTNLGQVADSLGHYAIAHIPTGDCILIVSAVGYKFRRLKVTIVETEAVELSTTLTVTQIDAGSIVVTGTRTPRYVKDVPVFTEVISKASIDDKSAHNIFEALDGEAGVRVEQQCQGCNFSILRMQGLGADHTQVLLDGQPVYSGLAGVYGLQQLSTANVDQIEIVKGAGSALYGSNAVGGAINIISVIPRKTEGRVGIEIGQHGTNRYEVSSSIRKNKLGLFLFAQQSEQTELDETGDVNADKGVDHPDGWIDRVRASARNAGFNLLLDDVIASDQLVFRGRLLNEMRLGGWLTNGQFENPFAPSSERIITDRYSGQLEYRVWLPRGAEVNASLVFTSHKRDATNDTFLGDYEEAYGESPPVDLLRPYVAEEELLIANLSLVQPVGNRHRVLAGGQFSKNRLEERGMYLDPATHEPYTSTSNKTAHEFGAYLQDEFKLSRKVEVVAGLRFDYHTSEDEFRGSGSILVDGLEPLEYEESTINPRFSAKYSITDDLILRGSMGTGFRVPYGFSEDLHLCSGSPRVYKGGALKPEKSFSYSLSADYTGSKIAAGVNMYRTELKNAIAFADADPEVADLGYTYQWENINNAHVMGAEFNGTIALMKGLTLGARFEIFEGKYDQPRDDWIGTVYEEISENIPRYPQTSAGLKMDYAHKQWNLIVDADYKGKMYIDLTEPADPVDVKIFETESFVLLNAKLSRAITDRYNVYVGAKNLSDYTQPEKHIDDAAFMYAPVYGRLVYGGVQVSL